MVLLSALVALSCSTASVEDNRMDDKIRDKIANMVHDEQGWKTQDVRVDEVEELRRAKCSIYTAGHKVRPISYQLNYAALPGDTVVSVADDRAVGKILDACGADAPAEWWADIITRFHKDLGAGLVLENEKENPGAIRKIQAAKKEFAPPKFSSEAGGKAVTYYLLDPEAFIVYSVKAIRNKDGSVTVEKADL